MTILLLDSFLSNDECDKYISEIDEKIIKRPFSDSAKSENDKYVDQELANLFYERFTSISRELDGDVIGANKWIMTAKYKTGDEFGLHTDTGLCYDIENSIYSRYTVLIYLNDNFQGGETVFYDDNFKETRVIVPKKGSALIFPMNIFHKGARVIGTKYWIGCEFMGKEPLL
jgi:prolyl 4-hydroxylase